jgi:hypothetical protein
LADQSKIEIEGRLGIYPTHAPANVLEYKIGELCKGDKIKVLLSDMRGEGNIKILLADTPISNQESCVNTLYGLSVAVVTNAPICCMCFLPALYCPKPTVPAIEENTITHGGEEKTFTVPKDGVYYLAMEAENGNVIYKGYIEIIKTEK